MSLQEKIILKRFRSQNFILSTYNIFSEISILYNFFYLYFSIYTSSTHIFNLNGTKEIMHIFFNLALENCNFLFGSFFRWYFLLWRSTLKRGIRLQRTNYLPSFSLFDELSGLGLQNLDSFSDTVSIFGIRICWFNCKFIFLKLWVTF